jgi:hypothetical protein
MSATALSAIVVAGLVLRLVLIEYDRRIQTKSYQSILQIVLMDLRTGHVEVKRIDLRERVTLTDDELGLTFSFQVNPKNPEIAGLLIKTTSGQDRGFGLTGMSSTYTFQNFRFTAVRYGGNVHLAKRELETDYFGLDEGPEFCSEDAVNGVRLVANSPAWCFIFAERALMEHVVLTPGWWRTLRNFLDVERLKTLPTARQVFWQVQMPFDEQSDQPVDGCYRRLPRYEEVQAFADRVGKTIALFVAHSNGYHGLSVERKFLVMPRRPSLLQAPLRNFLRGFCVA